MPKPPSSLFQSLTPLGIHSGCSTSTSLLVFLTCPILSRHGLHTRLYAESLIGHLSSKKVAPYPTSETAICGHLLFDISYNTSVHKNRNFIRLFLCLAVRSQWCAERFLYSLKVKCLGSSQTITAFIHQLWHLGQAISPYLSFLISETEC